MTHREFANLAKTKTMRSTLLLVTLFSIVLRVSAQTNEQKTADSLVQYLTRTGKMDSVMKETKTFTAWKTSGDFFSKHPTSRFYGDDESINGNGKVVIKD